MLLPFCLLRLLSSPRDTQETPPPVIRLAGPGNASGAPYGNAVFGFMRVKKILEDEFKAEGVKIDWQFPRGTGPAINEAFANGQLDFSNYGGLPNIVGRGAGLRTKVLASNGVSPVYVVARKDAPVNSIQDLKGKKISVSRGAIYEWSLNRILSTASLNERELEIFDLQSADQISGILVRPYRRDRRQQQPAGACRPRTGQGRLLRPQGTRGARHEFRVVRRRGGFRAQISRGHAAYRECFRQDGLLRVARGQSSGAS